jgi:hypothetical protein
MNEVLAIRPFVPSRDFAVSKAFYQALGFRLTLEDDTIAILKMGSFSFILQKFYAEGCADNFMLQMLMRDVDAWWAQAEPGKLVQTFGIKPPKAPAMQPWGMKVGFLIDPSGVLWHVAEVPF